MRREGVERIARQTRFSFIGIMLIAGLMTASALADRVFGLGWGYGPSDGFVGLGIMLSGCVVYGFCLLIFRFVRWVGL